MNQQEQSKEFDSAIASRLKSLDYDQALSQLIFAQHKARNQRLIRSLFAFTTIATLLILLVLPSLLSTLEWYYPTTWLNSSPSGLLTVLEDFNK